MSNDQEPVTSNDTHHRGRARDASIRVPPGSRPPVHALVRRLPLQPSGLKESGYARCCEQQQCATEHECGAIEPEV